LIQSRSDSTHDSKIRRQADTIGGVYYKPPARTAAEVRFCLDPDARKQLEELARTHDRTLSGELRRALRFYLANFELVDRTLRDAGAFERAPAVELRSIAISTEPASG
jgi:hypothetical protein